MKLFFNKMSSLYVKDPKKFEFIEEKNVNHRVITGMLQEAVTWFKKYL